jgi:diguanylate cyclase (GGDEF)-like protein
MAVIFVIELNRRLKRKEDDMFILTCFCVVAWFVANFLMLLTNDMQVISYLYHGKIIFVGYFAVFLLFFMLKFYRVFHKVPRFCIFLMLVIPSLTALVCLTGPWHSLLVERFDVVSLAPVRNFNIVWGAWFWVHTAWSYIMAMAVAVINLVYFFRAPKFYRTASSFMVAGVGVTLLSNIITLAHVFPSFLDTTVIGAGLSLSLYNKAIISNEKSQFARYTRRQILHFLDEYIFVLDDKKIIVDANQPAAEWFLAQGIPLTSATLHSVTDALRAKGKQIENDYYIEDIPFPIILNLRVHDLTDENKNAIGHIAVFTDVTENRILIERLEAKAKIDTLTGLPNRGAFEGAKKRLDSPEFLPLAVIVGDANLLKQVNDTLGHQYGDMMLKRMAEVLEKICPRHGFLARIGGDEFIFLLPGFSPEEAAALMRQIKEELALCRGLPFILSISLGSAVKYDAAEDIDAVMDRADSLMYEDKRAQKEAAGSSVLVD